MKRWIAALALVAVAGLVSLVVAELALRVFRLAPTEGLTTVTARQFDAIPGLFSPSRTFTDLRNRSLPHRVRIDSLGFRGEDVSRQPAAGVVRMVMLGDSFVYGDFVNDGETLPAQLERSLRERCGAVEVINAGLPGATINAYREVAQRARALQPDLFIVAFTENDVSDLAAESMWSQLARNRAAKSSFPFGILYPVLRRSALWNLAMQVRGRIRTLAARDAEPPSGAEAATGVRPDSALRSRYANELQQLVTEARAAEVPLIFVSFPAHFTVSGEWTSEQIDWADSVARATGIPVLETLPVLRQTGLPMTELFLLPHDGHPSAKGYAVAAAEVAAGLRDHPTLQSKCSPQVRP